MRMKVPKLGIQQPTRAGSSNGMQCWRWAQGEDDDGNSVSVISVRKRNSSAEGGSASNITKANGHLPSPCDNNNDSNRAWMQLAVSGTGGRTCYVWCQGSQRHGPADDGGRRTGVGWRVVATAWQSSIVFVVMLSAPLATSASLSSLRQSVYSYLLHLIIEK